MKRIAYLVVCMLLVLVCAVGCTFSKTFTYNVETGDSIKVKVTNYDIDGKLPFTITKDGKTIINGTFLTLEGYNYYVSAVDTDPGAELLDSGSANGGEYTFYKWSDGTVTQYNCVLKVDGSETAVMLNGVASQAEVEDAIANIEFTKQ